MVGLVLCTAVSGCSSDEGKKKAESSEQGSSAEANEVQEMEEREITFESVDFTVSGNESPLIEVYKNFLRGKEKVYTEKDRLTVWKGTGKENAVVFPTNDGYTIDAFFKEVVNMELKERDEFYFSSLYYTFLDCGMNGFPELALRAEFNTQFGSVTKEYVIKKIDDKLQICQCLDTESNNYCHLMNRYGLIYSGGISGAASEAFEEGIMTGKGDYQFVYEYTANYGVWALPEKAQDVLNDAVAKGEYTIPDSVWLGIYNFREYDGDPIREQKFWDSIIYSAQPGKDNARPAGYNQNTNEDFFRNVFDKTDYKYYSRGQVESKRESREAEVGMHGVMADAASIEWGRCDLDRHEINNFETVVVSDVDELMAAIGSKKAVYLNPGEYNVTEWINKNIEKLDFSDNGKTISSTLGYSNSKEVPTLVISGVNRLILESMDKKNQAKIICDVPDAQVIQFIDCLNVELNYVTFTHSASEEKISGDVLAMNKCVGMQLNNCNILGGAYGITSHDGKYLTVYASHMKNLSEGCFEAYDTVGVTFNRTLFTDCDAFCLYYLYNSESRFVGCNFNNLKGEYVYCYGNAPISFELCIYDGDALNQVTKLAEDKENIIMY